MRNCPIYTKTLTISNGTSLSPACALEATADSVGYAIPIGNRLGAIIMPAAWTAANLTFQGSADNANFFDLYDSTGTEYTVTAAASHTIIVNLADFAALRFIKIRSGTGGTPVNQGADRVLTLLLRQV